MYGFLVEERRGLEEGREGGGGSFFSWDLRWNFMDGAAVESRNLILEFI